MRSYLPVPSSWYLGLLGVNFLAASESADKDLLMRSLAGHNNAASDAYLGTNLIDSYRDGELAVF